MGRDRLYHRVCRLHFDRRRARRPPRSQTDFHGGLCDLHVGVARLRAGAVGGVPDRRAVRAGPGGGDPGAELADAAQSRLCRSEGARPRGRLLGGRRGWSHPLVIVGFAAAAVVGFLFVWHEARAPQPMLPLSLFAHRMFALTALVGVLFNIAFYGLIFVLSLYFQNIRGWSPFATGLAFVPMMAMVLPANLVAASVSERLGAPQTIALASVITAVGCVALLPMASDTSYWAIGAQLLVLGGGLGLLVPPLTSTLLGSVDKSRSGIAAGVLNATRQTGSVLGVALFGSLVGGGNEFIAGAHASLVISAAVLLAGAIAISYSRAREPR